jgi:hypothetical protein
LEINEKNIVEKIASENKFYLKNKSSCPSQFKIKDNFDSLKNFKKKSKVVLYEFRRKDDF